MSDVVICLSSHVFVTPPNLVWIRNGRDEVEIVIFPGTNEFLAFTASTRKIMVQVRLASAKAVRPDVMGFGGNNGFSAIL